MARKSDIRLRRSNVANAVPGGADLNEGELAINTADGALYFKKSDGTIITGHDNTIMHIDSADSRVGIGTTSPDYALDIRDNTNIQLKVSSIGASANARMTYAVDNTQKWNHGVIASNNEFTFYDVTTPATPFKLQQGAATNTLVVHSSSRVGIGTNSPSEKLDVRDGTITSRDATNTNYAELDRFGGLTLKGNGAAAKYITTPNTDDLGFKTNNIERARIDSSGNVGIGTSSPDTLLELFADNPVLRLRDSKVKGSSWAAGDALGGLEFYTSDTTGIGTHTVASITAVNGGQSVSSPDGEIVFSTGAYNTAASEVMRIDSSGNVGLGITNPSSYWGQADNLVVGGTGNDGITIKSSAAGNGRLAFTDTASSTAGLNDGGQIHYNHGSDYMALRTNGSERMRIDSSGNLLVGTTTQYGSTGITLQQDGLVYARRTGVPSYLRRDGSDGDIIYMEKDGTKVGSIGTKSDDVYIVTGDTGIRFNDGNDQIWPVNVSGASRDGAIDLGNSGVRFKDLHLSGNAYIGSSAYAQYFGNASDTNTLIQFAGSDDIRFRVGGTEKVRINTNGVGIGTSSPQANMALDVRSDASTAGSTGIASYGYNATGRAILGNGYATSGTGTNKGIEGISTGPRSSVSGSVNVGGHFYATGAENNYALTTGAGNVGINTSSPAKQLHIHQPSGETGFLLSRNNGLTSTNIQLSVDSTKTRFISYGDLTFMTATTGSGTNASERMRISTDGKVGIGTNSPGHKLHVVGANNTTPFSIDIGAAASYNFKANSNSTYSTTFNMDADGLTIGHDSAYREVALQTAGTNRLVIAPAGAITFNNAFTFPTSIGSAGQVLKVPNSGSVLVWSDQTGGGGSTDSISDADGDTKIQVEESADEDIIRFDIAGTEQLQLNSTGLVVAGNLTVNGTQTILNTATLSVDDLNITVADGAANAAAANGAGLTVDGANATLTYTAAEDRWNFNKKLYVPDNIRIAAPGPQLILQDTTDDDDHAIRFMDNGGTNRMSITTLGDDLRFETTGGRNFVFMGDTTNYGNVGIGTTAPTTALEVIGDIKIKQQSGYSNYSLIDASEALLTLETYSVNTSSYSADIIFKPAGTERMRIGDDGNVGIGTSSPTDKLTVSQSADSNGIRINGYDDRSDCFAEMHINAAGNTVIRQVNADSSGYLQIQAQNYLELSGPSLVYTSSNFRIYDAGSLQIGTHNDLELSHDGTNNLIKNINGNLYIRNDADDSDVIIQSDNGSGSLANYFMADGSTGQANLYHYGSLKLQTNSWGVLVNGTLNADALHIGSGATDLISVHNDGTFISTYRNNTGGVLDRRYADHGNDGTTVEYQARVGMDGNFTSVGNFSAHDFRLRTNNLDRMTVDGAGNIGIGLTNPSNLLHIHATGNGSSALIIEDDARRLEMGRDMIQAKSSNGSTVQNLYIQPAGKTIFASNSGSVGIGTASPSKKLHVQFSGDNGVRIESEDNHSSLFVDSHTGYGQYIRFTENNANNYWLNADTSGRLLFRPTATGTEGNIITFDSSGKVGIGKTTVKAKLQVEEYGIDTTTSSTTATTQVAIHTFPIADFRSARFTIQITNTTDSTYHSTEILAIHDGTTANITEFGEVHTGSSVEATFDADVSSGNFRLLATPTSTNSMTFKVVCHSLTV